MIAADRCVFTGHDLSAALAYDDRALLGEFAAVEFGAEIFGV